MSDITIIIEPAPEVVVQFGPTIVQSGGPGGGGAVDSVNGQTGVVVLVKGDVGLGNVDNTSDASKPVSTATASALAGKAATVHTHVIADTTGLQTALDGKQAAGSYAAAVHTHAQSDVTGLAAALAGKAATSHTHVEADVTGLTAALAGKAATAHTHAQSDVTGLSAALALLAPLASPAFTGTPTGITKSHVGLGNVDNTSDANKPVSTAQAAADALKADIASPTFTGDPKAPTPATADNDTSIATTAFVKAQGYAPLASPAFTGTPTGITKAHVGLGNVDNTSDLAKPVSTAQQTALDLKANLASPALTGNPTAPTPTAGDNDTSIATTAFVTAAVAAAGGGGSSVPTPRVVGYYYPPSIPVVSTDDGGTLTAGTAELLPFIVGGNSITLNSIGTTVGTAGAGGTVIRLGIYGSDTAGAPGSLVLDAGTITGDSTGDKVLTISQVLTPGLYWLTMVASAAGALRVRKTAGSATAWDAWTKGSSGTDVGDAGASLCTTGWTASSALPGTASLAGMTFRRQDIPLVFVRRSA